MKIKINGEIVRAKKGATILEVAKENGVKIPTLCNHPDVCVKGSCRLCLVQVKGKDNYVSACATKIKERMEIITHNPELEKIRKINLELLFSQHKEECQDCVWKSNCKLLSLARKYFVEINKFQDRKDSYPEYSFGNVIDFDSSKCIDCRNCVEVCPVSFLEMKNKDHKYEVEPVNDKVCVYCGQCINHCPAGSFESDGEFEKIAKPIKDGKDKKLIFQIAPAARISISEEFGLKPGTVSTEKLISGLKKLGADKVFDVSFGADFTTKKEAEEFLEKSKEDLPVFTSCCPSWVRFVEFYYPEFIPNLTTVRSPHIILGGLIKDNFKNPEDVVVVSVMPCVSKKYEITRSELEINEIRPVDYVLTVREVGRLLRDKKIDFNQLEKDEFDKPFGVASGDGLNYGASGGVMKAALKQAYKLKTGNDLLKEDLEIKKGELSFGLDDREIRARKVNGLKEAYEVLEKLKKNPDLYDYVEVMSCKGGCIGGGGQPVPTSIEIQNMRKEGLLKAAKKKQNESTFNNQKVDKICKNASNERLFFTNYKERKRTENIDTK
ncbi:MAG: [Fe-Fe] hydrogenase large subunit C-terminal domain-containing protein [Patescibacteria group bacterium]